MHILLHKILSRLSCDFQRLALILLAPLPLLYFGSLFYSHQQERTATQQRLSFLEKKFLLSSQQKLQEESFLQQLKTASPSFLDQEIESMRFCSNNPANRLIFIEDSSRKKRGILETEASLDQPVELDESDLKKLLCYLEGVEISPYTPLQNAPQIIITSFDLSKKRLNSLHNSYLVSLKILKREAER